MEEVAGGINNHIVVNWDDIFSSGLVDNLSSSSSLVSSCISFLTIASYQEGNHDKDADDVP